MFRDHRRPLPRHLDGGVHAHRKQHDVRVDDGASLKRCTDAWRLWKGAYGTLDGATCLDGLLKSNVVVAHDEAADFVEALTAPPPAKERAPS